MKYIIITRETESVISTTMILEILGTNNPLLPDYEQEKQLIAQFAQQLCISEATVYNEEEFKKKVEKENGILSLL